MTLVQQRVSARWRRKVAATEHPRCGGRGSESALYEVVCPVLYVVRVFGLAPYSYPKANEPARLAASKLYCLFSLLWLSFYTWVVSSTLSNYRETNRDKPVLDATEIAKLVLNYLTALAELLLTMGHRQQLAGVWNGIQDFDESFRLGGYHGSQLPRILRTSRFCVWFSLAASFLLWLAINLLGMQAFHDTYLSNLSYLLTYVGTYVASFKFIGLVSLLGQRFAYLNQLLASHCFYHPRHSIGHHDQELPIAKKIETWYNHLLSTSEKLNDIYSYSLFLFLLNLFFHTVSNMYFVTIWTIIEQSYLENPYVVFVMFLWTVVYVVQLLLIHVSCHFTSLEASRMANVMLDWRRRQAERHGKQHDFRSTLHYLNRRLKFTAAGCFDINLPVLTTTFGHITTYLVILLQIPDSS